MAHASAATTTEAIFSALPSGRAHQAADPYTGTGDNERRIREHAHRRRKVVSVVLIAVEMLVALL